MRGIGSFKKLSVVSGPSSIARDLAKQEDEPSTVSN